MALSVQNIAQFVIVFALSYYFTGYCADLSSTTPWPQLGARRTWKTTTTSTTSPPKRDYVNAQLSYSGVASSTGNSGPPRRDYVNPNIRLSYDSHPASKPVLQPTALSTRPPLRDYVNPNVKPSYSNVLSNNKPTGSTLPSSSPGSTTPKAGNPATTPKSGNPTTLIPGGDRVKEDEELREFSEALLRKDTNNAFKYVTVNYQGKTRSSSLKDEAPEHLLNINSSAYKIPSIEKMMLLYNNYILKSDENEVYTAQEKIEENNFLDTILSTSVMQHARNFLILKGKISKDPKDFKDVLRTIWFNMYSRGGGKIGSSGFEHVFLAEIKNNAISGLHNWIYFNEEEKKNAANYLGYLKKLEFDKGAIVMLHFNYHQIDKPVGSMFIGTSPELEIALYSTCFLLRADEICPLRLGGKNFIVRTYTYRYRGKKMIGSVFPEI